MLMVLLCLCDLACSQCLQIASRLCVVGVSVCVLTDLQIEIAREASQQQQQQQQAAGVDTARQGRKR